MAKKGILYTIGSAVVFGFIPLLTMLVYQGGGSAMTVVFFRSFFVACILFVILRLSHISFSLQPRDIRNIWLISWFGTGLTTILLNQAYRYIDTGTATNLHFLYPLFVALLCRFFFRERLSHQRYLALGVAAMAIFIFLLEGGGGEPIGYGMAILSGLTYAFYMVWMEKSGLARMEAMKLSFYTAVFVSIEAGGVHVVSHSIVFDLPWPIYVLLVVIACASSFLAVIWMQKGIYYLGSTTASVFCLFEPITSLLCGFFFLGEPLSLYKVIGCLFILLSLLLFAWRPAASQAGNENKDKGETA